MRTQRTLAVVCLLAIAPLCVVRGREEEEIPTKVVGPHFSSLSDEVSLPIPIPLPENPSPIWDRKLFIVNGGTHQDTLIDPKPYRKKDAFKDPWWPRPKSDRPPKSISPRGHSKYRTGTHHRR